MTTHEIKCHPEYFQALKDGRKKFEVRSTADRRFEVDDVLLEREWDPKTEEYTGEVLELKVTYVLRDSDGPWFRPNHCAMGVELVNHWVT